MIEGIPSIAISCDVNSFEIVKNEIDSVLEYVFNNKLFSKEYTLNINFPVKDYTKSKGIKFAHQGIKRFKSSFKKISDDIYRENGSDIKYDTDVNSDVFLADKGYITFVPISINQTNYSILKIFKDSIE